MASLSSKALSRKSAQKSRLTRRLTGFRLLEAFWAIFIAVFAYLLLNEAERQLFDGSRFCLHFFFLNGGVVKAPSPREPSGSPFFFYQEVFLWAVFMIVWLKISFYETSALPRDAITCSTRARSLRFSCVLPKTWENLKFGNFSCINSKSNNWPTRRIGKFTRP